MPVTNKVQKFVLDVFKGLNLATVTWLPVPPDSFLNSASVQSVNPNTIPSGFSTNKDLVHIFRIFTDCFTPELG